MRANIVRKSTNSSLNRSKFIRGDSEEIIVKITGQSLVLTNFGFTFTAKISPNDPDSSAIIQKTTATGEGITATLPAPNQLEAVIAILPADSEILMDGDKIYYDIQMTTASPASTRTLEKGYFTIEGDITLDNASPLIPAV